MPCRKIIVNPTNNMYIYDGSLEGLFCCLYESVYSRELPGIIVRESQAEPSLLCQKFIATDVKKARRVENSIISKISNRALTLVKNVFLSCEKQKEIAILRFLVFAFEVGEKATDMLSHPIVLPLIKAERALIHEQHSYLGFLRFADYDGVLVAKISPKNFVLPYIAGHFADRYKNEKFVIYDKTNKAALFYKNNKQKILPIEDFESYEYTDTEKNYRQLWKSFFHAVAIKERENPAAQRSHLPKRYWQEMTEMQNSNDDLL